MSDDPGIKDVKFKSNDADGWGHKRIDPPWSKLIDPPWGKIADPPRW